MIVRTSSIFIAALLTAVGASAFAGELELGADTPSIPVETRREGRNFIRLPALEYTIRVRPNCSANQSPSRLSLSIADTRVVLDEDALTAGVMLDVPFQVPSGQIGPVAVEGFCLADEAGAEPGESSMMVPSVLSIQASLLCIGQSGNEMIYASKALDVTLDCARQQDSTTPKEVSVTSREMPIEESHGS